MVTNTEQVGVAKRFVPLANTIQQEDVTTAHKIAVMAIFIAIRYVDVYENVLMVIFGVTAKTDASEVPGKKGSFSSYNLK